MSEATTQTPDLPPVFQAMVDAASKAIGIDILPDVDRALRIASATRCLVIDPHPQLLDIVKEYSRQEQKWGVQDHTPPHWIAIMTEELGEAAKASVNACLGGDDSRTKEEWLADYRTELVQLGALAVQAIACIDRGEWGRSDAEVEIEALDWHCTAVDKGVRNHWAHGVGRVTFSILDDGHSPVGLRQNESTSIGIPSVDEAKALAETRHRKAVLRAIGMEVADAE